MKYRVRFIVQGVMQARTYDSLDKANRFYFFLRASPEVDKVYAVELA